MKLSELQKEFKNYLSSLNTTQNVQTEETSDVSNEMTESSSEENDEKKYDLENKNVSVFSYADEFDKFLNAKYKDDIDEAKMKTDDLLNLKFENGKFIEEGTKSKQSENKLPLVGILNDLFTDEKMKTIIDSDSDGKIDKEEATEFLKAIDDLDGQKGDISIKDLLAGTKKIQDLDLSDYDSEDDTTSGNPSSPGGVSAGSPGTVNNTSIAPYSVQSAPSGSVSDEELEELEQQKIEKENEVKSAQEEYNRVFTGENENVQAAQNSYDNAKADYEKLLEEKEKLEAEQQKQIEEAVKQIEEETQAVDEAQAKLQESETAISSQEAIIAQDEASLSTLKDSLNAVKQQEGDKDDDSKSEIQSKTAELNSKISEAQEKLENDKAKLQELTEARDNAKSELETKQKNLEQAQNKKTELETEFAAANEKMSQELDSALTACNEAEKNVQTVKDTEASSAQNKIDNAQGELNAINEKIAELQAERQAQNVVQPTAYNEVEATSAPNSMNITPVELNAGSDDESEDETETTDENNKLSKLNFNFNFKENLSSQQKADLENFKANFKKNKSKYEEVAKKTGMPAQLIAAIHWRESGGDFTTYLHNGEKLGKPTTMVPAGIYFGANQWTEAAVDAIKRQGTSGVNKKNFKSLLDFAERYNGLGYKNKGVASPYVWAGTTNYKGGKYVADGVYDANYVDQQLGVAVMMKAIS